MEKVKVARVMPGMKVGKNIFDRYGKLLLTEGTFINPQQIRKLELYNIMEIFIDEKSSNQPESCKYESKHNVIYNEAFSAIKNIMNNIRNNNEIDTAAMAEIVEEIVARVNEDPEAFLRLNSIRDMDNYTFLHSVDVCIYSIILGKSKGINGKDLVKLGLGAMLHDVGKSRVPSEILLKPGMLDEGEFEEMKKHTIFGYEIICNSPSLDKTIADIALKHHERWDGKGYPSGLRGSELDLYSKIVTICDIYDALTADRVYRGRILPHEAAEYIVNNEMIITDPELTKHFVENVAIYPVGATVLLSTGEIGRISRIDRSMPLRPVIDIFSHRDTDKRISGHRLNLMENLTVFIVDIIG